MQFQKIRGVRDLRPSETPIWQYVESVCRSQFEAFGYGELRTPLIEPVHLFTRSLGEGSDVVRKEMYVFKDKGDREIALRPEGTAPVVRSILEDGSIQNTKGGVLKLYYIGRMYRYDRPQEGRYREFYQAGVEAIGSLNPILDVEVILLAVDLFSRLELEGLSVSLNSIGCKICRPGFQKALKDYFEKFSDQLCTDCGDRWEKNILRILDCKNESCKKIVIDAPKSTDHLCKECGDHFLQVQSLLKKRRVAFQLDPLLVRGLDYYTRTAFEIISGTLGTQNAVCGGGRYDNLIEEFGGPDTPAVGFAIGLDRLVSILPIEVREKTKQSIDVLVFPLGKDAQDVALSLCLSLRAKGIRTDMGFEDRGLKGSLKTASNMGAKVVLILGEDELKKDVVQLRDMEMGEQSEVRLAEVVSRVESMLERKS